MTVEDARIIFNNIGELATFSDMFSERLEKALGNILEDGIGEDYVGALFLEMVRLSTHRAGQKETVFQTLTPDHSIL